jgi:hypothetical protein
MKGERRWNTIDIDLNRRQLAYLRFLLLTGLWGKTIEEVCSRVIDSALWERIYQPKREPAPKKRPPRRGRKL